MKKKIIGALVGGVLGFSYYYFIGCTSGSCPITSNPIASTVWGSLFGFFMVSRPCCASGQCELPDDPAEIADNNLKTEESN